VDAWSLALAFVALVFLMLFAFTSGYNDASAVVATLIASQAARPRSAVLLAAATCAAGILWGGAAVARTVSGLVALPASTHGTGLLAAALAGAVLWNLVAARLGLPSSTSHALVGGLVGAALVAVGPGSVNWGLGWLANPLGSPVQGVAGVVVAMLVSPLLGFGAGFAAQRAARVALRRAHARVNRTLRRLQLVASSLLSFAHGANDGQKSIGLFVLVLMSVGAADGPTVPWPAIVLVTGAITLGTLGGGWPIVTTLSRRIFDIEPVHALNSQIASAGVVFGATVAGGPVSTTQVVSASVMGVGAERAFSDVRWSVAKRILQGWAITIPASGLMAAAFEAVLHGALGI
jgi:PiT family inorganic phosphate transporter